MAISAGKISIYQNISLALAMIICLLMTLTVTVIYFPDDEDIEYDLGTYYFVINVLSAVQFMFAIIYSILWFINHSRLAIGKYELDRKAEQKKQGEDSSHVIEESSILKFLFSIPGMKYIFCLAAYDQEFSGIMLFIFGSFMGTLYKT